MCVPLENCHEEHQYISLILKNVFKQEEIYMLITELPPISELLFPV